LGMAEAEPARPGVPAVGRVPAGQAPLAREPGPGQAKLLCVSGASGLGSSGSSPAGLLRRCLRSQRACWCVVRGAWCCTVHTPGMCPGRCSALVCPNAWPRLIWLHPCNETGAFSAEVTHLAISAISQWLWERGLGGMRCPQPVETKHNRRHKRNNCGRGQQTAHGRTPRLLGLLCGDGV